jgi:hypothetical protein
VYRASNRVVFSPGLKRSGPDDFFNSIITLWDTVLLEPARRNVNGLETRY